MLSIGSTEVLTSDTYFTANAIDDVKHEGLESTVTLRDCLDWLLGV